MKGHILQIVEASDQVKAVTFHHVLKQSTKLEERTCSGRKHGDLNRADIHVLLWEAASSCVPQNKGLLLVS